MAIYHCTCQVVSRGQGRSAVGAAAYRSGSEIVNEYDGLVHDYTNKSGVVHSEVMLCAYAPAEYADRAVLWNAVERVEKSAKAQLCREYEMALPRELTPEERVAFVRDFIKKNFTDKGMIADFSIHDKGDGNPHVHILLTMRPIEKDGSWGDKQKKEYILDKQGNKQYDKKKKTYKCKTVKTTDWDSKETLSRNREAWAAAVNTALQAKGIAERVDHRSLEAQGIDRVPTVHEGAARAKRKKDIRKFRRGQIPVLPELPRSLAINAEARKTNVEIVKIDKEISALDRAIGQIKADNLWLGVYEKINDILERANSARHIAQLQTVCVGELYKMKGAGFNSIINNPLMQHHAHTYYEDNKPYLNFHREKATIDLTTAISEIENNIKCFDDGKKYKEQDVANWWDYPKYLRYEYIPIEEEQPPKAQPAPVAAMENKVEPVPTPTPTPIPADTTAPEQAVDAPSWMVELAEKEGIEVATFSVGTEPSEPAQNTTTAKAAEHKPAAPPFDVQGVARKLHQYEQEVYAQLERSFSVGKNYKANPIYAQHANKLADLADKQKEISQSIKDLRAEQAQLGLFQGKRKKELAAKIYTFKKSMDDVAKQIKELGVENPLSHREKVDRSRELVALHELEKAKEKESREIRDAEPKAEAAKAAFVELARTVPEAERAAVRAAMEELAKADKERSDTGKSNPRSRFDRPNMEQWQAITSAKKELDAALAPTDKGRDPGRAPWRLDDPNKPNKPSNPGGGPEDR